MYCKTNWRPLVAKFYKLYVDEYYHDQHEYSSQGNKENLGDIFQVICAGLLVMIRILFLILFGY